MSYEQVSKDLEKVIGYIHSEELTDTEKEIMTKETVEYFDTYVSPGWLKYRKSVSTNSAVLEWRDHGSVCEGLYREPYTPMIQQVQHVEFGNAQDARKAVRNLVAVGEKVAAIIVEPIQGEAGVIVPPAGYLAKLREICDEYGVALIFDEIQCGMGRTGAMWRCETEGVVPDIMTFGKAFGGGIMPITGIICRPNMWTEELIDNPWLLGSPTFGGNPVCCSAAIATIKYMIDKDVPSQCKEKGEYLIAGLKTLKEKYPTVIGDVRGVGLMLAVEFVNSEVGYSVAKGMFSRGVMTAGTLVNAKCVRFEPAAIITIEQIKAVIARMDEALSDTKAEFQL